MIRIGPSRFRGISSDSTGNTSSGRMLIQDDFPWVIILPDSCHRMDKLCKDITKINYFQPVSSSLYISLRLLCFVVSKYISRLFRNSVHASNILKSQPLLQPIFTFSVNTLELNRVLSQLGKPGLGPYTMQGSQFVVI
jgi:hypothetical protein